MVALAMKGNGNAVDEHALIEELAGNICRCTGYRGIVHAVKRFLDDPVKRPSDA
jgi:aerobic-type carbon monoxide dehydrogenase small subunit (CoxS/CutS family)